MHSSIKQMFNVQLLKELQLSAEFPVTSYSLHVISRPGTSQTCAIFNPHPPNPKNKFNPCTENSQEFATIQRQYFVYILPNSTNIKPNLNPNRANTTSNHWLNRQRSSGVFIQ